MVIAFGEVLWDLLPSGRQLGGAVANCAYRLHQLGTPVTFVSRIGNDELGAEALEILKEKGLPCPMLQTDTQYPTGTVDVSVSDAGDAEYVINEGVAYDHIDCNEQLLSAAKDASAIIFGNLIQRNDKSRSSLYALIEAAPKALKVVDINLRKDCYTAETVRQSFARTDVLKLNEKEVSVVSELLELDVTTKEEFCKKASDKFGITTILVSMGADGVYAYDTLEGEVSIPGYSIKVADTVGAGDNFTAGFVHKRLQGSDLKTCCSFANLIGSMVATKVGGMPSISADDIKQYRESHDTQQASA